MTKFILDIYGRMYSLYAKVRSWVEPRGVTPPPPPPKSEKLKKKTTKSKAKASGGS